MPDEADAPPVISPPQSGFIANVSLPQKFDTKGNLAANWKKWVQVWKAYEIVTGLDKQPSTLRVATFITCIGPDALEIHTGLPFSSDAERENMDKVLELWQNYCIGRTNVIYERYKFNNRSQQADESIDAYTTALRTLAETCEFGLLKDDLIRDHLVCGIRDNGQRKKLLQEPKLILEKCLDSCRAAEATKLQVQDMPSQGKESSEVNALKSSRPKSHTSMVDDCKFCGKSHERNREKCPAFGQICKKCKKENHVASKCHLHGKKSVSKEKKPKATKPSSKKSNWKKVNALEAVTSSEEELLAVDLSTEDVNVNTAEVVDVSDFPSKIYAAMEIQGKTVKMQIDSGAPCNVLPKEYLPEGAEVQKTNKLLTAYNKERIPALGTTRISMRNPKTRKKYNAEFVVVDGSYTPLLGARAAQQMGFIVVQHHNIQLLSNNEVFTASPSSSLTKEQVLTDFGDLFKGLGKMDGKLHLEVNESVPPVIMPPRRVPVALKGKFKEEIDRLVSVGVLEKVEEPTKWVSSAVVTAKANGKVRVCIDPRPLNEALSRSHYPLPVIDDILPELGKARVFSKADLKGGFLQIELDDQSSRLTTFQTPWGRHRWLRMPYGISPAPEYFQQKLDENLQGLPGVYRIADDLLITGQGDTKEEADKDHDANLVRLLQRCRDRNIKLNKAKFDFKCSQVPFIGHLLSNEGVKPDPKKIEAIVKMETPTDVQGVQRLIGMVKYLSKFLSNLSALCEPLRKLTHKDVEWHWTQEQEDAFQSLKTAVTQAPVLKYFSPQAQTEGQGDTSQNGLGFVLMQEGQPVTYASRALTPTEQRYSQIEKELLAQVFGLEHNHHYTFGRRVILWTDHKPLVSIYKKPLVSAPKRLQRLLLRLQQYDVDLKYKPGSEMYLADTLSRASLKNITQSKAEEETESIHAADFLSVSEPQLTEIQAETAQDDTLQQLKKTIISGWPETKKEVPVSLHPYFLVRDELSAQDGLIFKGQRCVIPLSLRARIKEKLHGAHTGIQSCLRRARETVYWPGMNSELTDYISKCDICSCYQSSQPKEPLICHEIADRSWQKIGVDVFTLDDTDYLCVVDYYSSYFEVDRLESKTAANTAKKLRKQFSVHGIPNQLISDNMPFNSLEFKDFAANYEFEVITSSPGYPQSNGKVETAKNIMKKAKQAGTDVY